MRILIESIPHTNQRYETTGDWIIHPNGDITIYVSETGAWKTDYLVALHELIEVALCIDRGISEEEVNTFDISHPELEDPGDDIRAPYYKEHQVAVAIERMAAAELNVNWDKHLQTLYNLYTAPDQV
jgi:hypothetical protein